MFEPSEEQFSEARESKINAEAEKLLDGDLLDLFCEMEDASQFLKDLYCAGTFGLVNLQERFRIRMAHEALLKATRKQDRASNDAYLFMALQDENAIESLSFRRD